MVEDVKQYCDYHQLTDVNVIGHSMGGKVAMLPTTTYRIGFQINCVADIGQNIMRHITKQY